jgi:phosphopantothenoylcysteine decarboxylase/phosphopantothenate--cysteine ligase
MAEPEEIYQYISKYFQKKKILSGKRILLTAGPCREAIDPVRFISNRSSGKMGFALAQAAKDFGAKVTLITGPTDLLAGPDIHQIQIESTEEMYKAVRKEFSRNNMLIMAAAPADYKSKKIAGQKIKKDFNDLSLELIPTVDILTSIKSIKKKNQIVIGFALETENGEKNALAKLKNKGLDLIVLNMVAEQTPFDSDTNKVTLMYKNGQKTSFPMMSKRELAWQLMEKFGELM